MATASEDLVQRCRRSARYWRAWLETGISSPAEADAVFTDTTLRTRLSAPLRRFDETAQPDGFSAASSSTALSPQAAKIAESAATSLGVKRDVADDLLRLLADERLAGFTVLHHDGSLFDLLDLSSGDVLSELALLVHSERCESLQALAALLRGAHDDSHKFAAQCRELAQKLLSDGLEESLWQTYKQVSSCPKFSEAPSHAEVLSCVRQGLDLQLCVLECLLLAGYDPELSRPNPEHVCRMVDLFFRQRFLGSLPRAAHHHHWLLSNAAICAQAQAVGDLCLTLLLEAFTLEASSRPGPEHPLLSSPQHAQHLHRHFTTEWLDICERAAVHDASTAPAATHCACHAALATLGWASLLASAPQSYREAHGLAFERILTSAVIRSRHLLPDAAQNIIDRAFLTKDGPDAQHSAARAILRGFVATASAAFQLTGSMTSAGIALTTLAAASFEGEAIACIRFWQSDYPKRRGTFHLLHTWLTAFPSMPGLLDALSGLAAASCASEESEEKAAAEGAALYVCELLQAPLQSLLLPYQLLQHHTEVSTEAGPSTSTSSRGTYVILHDAAYVEELALRTAGLVIPDWHVSTCKVLRRGSKGRLEQDRLLSSQGGSRSHFVRWELGDQGVSTLRVIVCAWDALLQGFGWTRLGSTSTDKKPSAVQLFHSIVRCICHMLISNPDSLHLLSKEFDGNSGLVTRLLTSVFAAASLTDSKGFQVITLALNALAAICRADEATISSTSSGESHAAQILRFLEGASEQFRAGKASDLAAIFISTADREKEEGTYPTTLAALDFIAALLEAFQPELFLLRRSRKRDVDSDASLIEEVMSPLLDFTFGHCFSRCRTWPGRTTSHRFAVFSACLRVVDTTLPVMHIFNWPDSATGCLPPPVMKATGLLSSVSGQNTSWWSQILPGAALGAGIPQGETMSLAARSLRSFQLRVLRCWGETSFIPTLLLCILCDAAFLPACNTAPTRSGQFVGFWSLALAVEAHSGAPDVFSAANLSGVLTITSGARFIASALRTCRCILTLFLSPAGFAPHYNSFATYLLQLTSTRESLSPILAGTPAASSLVTTPGNSTAVFPRRRADLIQSLYAHLCCKSEPHVAERAAEALMTISAFWARFDPALLSPTGPVDANRNNTEQQLLQQRWQDQQSSLQLQQPGQLGQAQPGPSQVAQYMPGQLQLGASQFGQLQSGISQPGLGQFGPSQLGLGQSAQPGQWQTGLLQPGTSQLGFGQPGQQTGLLSSAFSALPNAGMVFNGSSSAMSTGRPVSRALPLLAHLSVPQVLTFDVPSDPSSAQATSSRPTLLSLHMARRLLDVLRDETQPLSLRCAFVELLRAVLVAQPALLASADGKDLLPDTAEACVQLLMQLMRLSSEAAGLKEPSTAARLLVSALSLLDDLASKSKSLLVQTFSKPSQASSTGSGWSSTWQLLAEVLTKQLEPWIRTSRAPFASSQTSTYQAFIALAAILRLAERGSSEADAISAHSPEAHGHLTAMLKTLLKPDMLELWLPDSHSENNMLAVADDLGDFEMLRHPYGKLEGTETSKQSYRGVLRGSRDASDRFLGLVAKLGLSSEVLAPSHNATTRMLSASLLSTTAVAGSKDALRIPITAAISSISMASTAGVVKVPKSFRCWADLCEMAFGNALGAEESKRLLRHTLPQEKIGVFGDFASVHCGSDVLDAFVISSSMLPLHAGTALLAAVCAMTDACKTDVGLAKLPKDFQEMQLMLSTFSESQAATASSVLALEAFDDLARSVAQRATSGPTAGEWCKLLAELLKGLLVKLFRDLQHLGLLMDNSRFFARLLALTTHLLALPPHAAGLASPSQAFGPFSSLNPPGSTPDDSSEGQIKELLSHRTSAGLALLKQLTMILSSCARSFDSKTGKGICFPPKALDMLPAYDLRALNASLEEARRRLGSQAANAMSGPRQNFLPKRQSQGQAEVALHALSILMQLTPALRRSSPAEAKEGSLQVLSLLGELLEVLSDLVECVSNQAGDSESRAQLVPAGSSTNPLPGGMGNLSSSTLTQATGGAAQPWMTSTTMGASTPSFAGTSGPTPNLLSSNTLVQGISNTTSTFPSSSGPFQMASTPSTPSRVEEAAFIAYATAIADLEVQAERLDLALRSGVISLVLSLTERVLLVMQEQEGILGAKSSKETVATSGRSLGILQRVLLPRLLSCSFSVFSPGLDASFSRATSSRTSQGLATLGSMPKPDAAWQRATEVAWATRLDAVLSLFLGAARSPPGASLLLEQRLFTFLAYCPLLRYAVLPAKDSTQFPDAYSIQSQLANAYPPTPSQSSSTPQWRRPLHSSWCRALLLVATCLATAAEQQVRAEAESFLQVYAPRLRHVFTSALQSGQMAILEEASLACRVLALMSGSAIVESLISDAATQALLFVVVSCYGADRSKVFLPLSLEERIAAKVSLEGRPSPASIPSIFHQRQEYLSLEFLRNILFALVRISASPRWLGVVTASGKFYANPAAAGWPSQPSVLGLRTTPSGTFVASETEPQKLWASIMDVCLEAARRVVDLLEALKVASEAPHLMVTNKVDTTRVGGDPWIPLSLSLVGIGEMQAAPTSDGKKQALRYKWAVRRPCSTLSAGATPEGISVRELRSLCGSILELSCTLLFRFCEVLRPSLFPQGATGSPTLTPGAVILQNLLSFLHELLDSKIDRLGLDASAEYLSQLAESLRAAYNLASDETDVLHHALWSSNAAALDGDAWLLGEE